MQILVMLFFLAVWLLILWSGSIALEATGMERGKARFQALSALSGTGFTTSEAESVVEHPKRRRIATCLIFIGNAGIISFIILLVLYVRAGLAAPSVFAIIITVAALLAIVLAYWIGLIDKLTNAILSLLGKGKAVSHLVVEKIIYQAGDYEVVRLAVSEQFVKVNSKLKDAGFQEKGATVLSIERGGTVLFSPQSDEKLVAGDYLLCYGSRTEIIAVTSE